MTAVGPGCERERGVRRFNGSELGREPGSEAAGEAPGWVARSRVTRIFLVRDVRDGETSLEPDKACLRRRPRHADVVR